MSVPPCNQVLNLCLFLILIFLISCQEKVDLPKSKDNNQIPGWDYYEVEVTYSSGLVDFHFLDENAGFTFGNLLLKTIDGGKNWESIAPFIQKLNRSAFSVVDEDHLFYVYDTLDVGQERIRSIFFRTVDGGESWEKLDPGKYILYEIDFKNSLQGWALGFEPNENLNIYKLLTTIDGGLTWQEVETVEFPGYNPNKIKWKTKDLGFILTGGMISYVTVDAGQTWEVFARDLPDLPLGIYAISREELFFVLHNKTIFSQNGGNTWIETNPKRVFVLSMDGDIGVGVEPDQDCIYDAPCKSTYVSTRDRGKTWDRHFSSMNNLFRFNQEVKPGLVTYYQRSSKKFLWFKKN